MAVSHGIHAARNDASHTHTYSVTEDGGRASDALTAHTEFDHSLR